MDLIASQIAQLQEQSRLQEASIAQLRSTVSTLSSQNEAQASIIARLSSENETKDRAIIQLEKKVFPDGCWIWERFEGGAGKGQSRWSKDVHPLPPTPSKPRPPASFNSLPVELLRIIFFSAEQPERALFTRLSFRHLELFGPLLNSKVKLWNPRMAMLYMTPRLIKGANFPRLAPSLATSHLTLDYDLQENAEDELHTILEERGTPFPFLQLRLAGLAGVQHISIPHLTIEATFHLESAIYTWSNLLLPVQPTHLTLSLPSTLPPSLERHADLNQMPYRRVCNQLRSVTSIGPCSVFLFPKRAAEGREDASIWKPCFEGASQAQGPTTMEFETWLKTKYRDERKEEEEVRAVDFDSTFRLRNLSDLSSEEWKRSVCAVLRRKEDRVREEEEKMAS